MSLGFLFFFAGAVASARRNETFPTAPSRVLHTGKEKKKKKEDLIIIMIKNVIGRSRDDGAYHQVRYRQSLIKLIPARKKKMDADSRGEKNRNNKTRRVI